MAIIKKLASFFSKRGANPELLMVDAYTGFYIDYGSNGSYIKLTEDSGVAILKGTGGIHLNDSAYNEVHITTNKPYYTNQNEDLAQPMRMVTSIGEWDMDSTHTKTVDISPGANFNVVGISSVMINHDGGDKKYIALGSYKNVNPDVWIDEYDSATGVLTLKNLNGGFFDGAGFSTASNRGWVISDILHDDYLSTIPGVT